MNRLHRVVKYFTCLFIFTVTATGPSHAIEALFDGYGTASISCFDNKTADYVLNDQSHGPGRSSRCDTGIDSLLGLQLDLTLHEAVNFNLQFIADRREDSNYSLNPLVAQFRFRVNNILTFRLGRMPTPAFIHSENRQVRFTLPWVRPPLEVYGLLPTFSQDGVELIYQNHLADWHAEWHGSIGVLDFDSPISNSTDIYPVEASQIYMNLTLRKLNTLFKIGYGYGEVSIDYPDTQILFDALSTFVTGGSELVDDLNIDNSRSHMFTIGITNNWHQWFLVSEFAYRTLEGYFRDQTGAYITLGKKINRWTPYFTLARRHSSGPDSDSRAGFLQTEVEILLAGSRFDNTSLSAGLIYDINEQTKLKFQSDWIKPDRNSWGLLTNHSSEYNFNDPDSSWLISLSLDFVF